MLYPIELRAHRRSAYAHPVRLESVNSTNKTGQALLSPRIADSGERLFIGAPPLLMFRCKTTPEENHAEPAPRLFSHAALVIPEEIRRRDLKNMNFPLYAVRYTIFNLGRAGFEPATPWSQTMYASQTAPPPEQGDSAYALPLQIR